MWQLRLMVVATVLLYLYLAYTWFNCAPKLLEGEFFTLKYIQCGSGIYDIEIQMDDTLL